LERKEKGFWAALFDFSFESFALPRLVPILYIIGVVFLVLVILFYLVLAFSGNIWLGFLMLIIGAPALFFVGILSWRVWLEVMLILFQLREDLLEIKKAKGEKIEEGGEKIEEEKE